MKRESRQQPFAVGIGFLLLLFALNYAWASFFHYPIVYCVAQPLAPLVAPVWQWAFWLGLATFVVVLYSKGAEKDGIKLGKMDGLLQALALFFLLGSLPDLLGTLFLSFKGCGP